LKGKTPFRKKECKMTRKDLKETIELLTDINRSIRNELELDNVIMPMDFVMVKANDKWYKGIVIHRELYKKGDKLIGYSWWVKYFEENQDDDFILNEWYGYFDKNHITKDTLQV
jgi:hypothetical protein